MSIKQDFIQKIFLLSLIIIFNTLAVTAISIPTAVKQKMFVESLVVNLDSMGFISKDLKAGFYL